MIKSTVNKTTFAATITDLARKHHATRARVALADLDVVLVLESKRAEPVRVQLVTARTVYGADATAEKWGRWTAEIMTDYRAALETATRKREGDRALQRNAAERAARAIGTGSMTDAEIKAWAAARLGWAVFFLTGWLEDGEVRSGAKPWAHITGAGIDGHIFVEVDDVKRSIPLHMVINSAAKLGAMSRPTSQGAAKGAPAMCYAVFSPDTPDAAINDQLEKFEMELRAKIKELIRLAVAEDLARLCELAAPITQPIPVPSLIQSSGESPRFPFGMEPAALTKPESGARPYVRHVYAVDLPGWQDPDLVRRQRDLLAYVVAELIGCADQSRDADELRRARDMLEQARKAGAPV